MYVPIYIFFFFSSGDDEFQMCNITKSVKQNAKVKNLRFIQLVVILNCKSVTDTEIIFYVVCVKLIKVKQMGHIHTARVNYQRKVNAAWAIRLEGTC